MTTESLVQAIWGTLQSLNEYDSNGEAANVVDGLFAIARAIHHLAQATEGVRTDGEHERYHAAREPVRYRLDSPDLAPFRKPRP